MAQTLCVVLTDILQNDCRKPVNSAHSPAVKRKLFNDEEDAYTRRSSSISKRLTKELEDSSHTDVSLDESVQVKSVKKNFCFYCYKLFSKLTPHLESRHPNEKEVKHFSLLPKGSGDRKRIIETIRRRGNFLFNRSKTSDDIIIPCRQSKKNENKKVAFKVCPNCKGYFSTTSIRKHVRRCVNKNDRKKNILILSRKVDNEVHKSACKILKEEVLPVLRDGVISSFIRNDEFLITYGNRLCSKFRTSSHHHDMIRSRLRTLTKVFLNVKEHYPIVDNNFNSVFDPIFYDAIIAGINSVSRLNESSGKYGAPSTAFNLGIWIKEATNLHISQCIKNGEEQKRVKAENLLKLMRDDFTTSINKTVLENQREFRRTKKVILPKNNDIKLLHKFLTERRRTCFSELKKRGFIFKEWKELASYTLISLQLFNRRRAGEIERIMIKNYNTRQSVDETTDPDIYKTLSMESRSAVKQYVRFEIRGKLDRGVPVLMHKELEQYIDYILEHRKEAGVSATNKYVFGIPGERRNFLRACNLIREYSVACGAADPETLRGTQLRKHIATQSVLMDLQENEVHDLANFLGHDEKIHRDHYRLPIITRDIALMSKLLEKAQGGTEPDDGLGKVSGDENEGCVSSTRKNERYLPSSSRETNEPEQKDKDTTSTFEEIEDPMLMNNTFSDDSIEDPNFIPNDDDDDDLMKTPTKKIKKQYLDVIKRTTWTTPEKIIARSLLAKTKKTNKLPSTHECHFYVTKYAELRNRTPVQLKVWIHNQLKNENQTVRKQTGRINWTTPERKALRLAFKKNFDSKTLPSLAECKQAVQNYPALKSRTPVVIKAQVNNKIRSQYRC